MLFHLELNFKQRLVVVDVGFEDWGVSYHISISYWVISSDISQFQLRNIRSRYAFRPIARKQKYLIEHNNGFFPRFSWGIFGLVTRSYQKKFQLLIISSIFTRGWQIFNKFKTFVNRCFTCVSAHHTSVFTMSTLVNSLSSRTISPTVNALRLKCHSSLLNCYQ